MRAIRSVASILVWLAGCGDPAAPEALPPAPSAVAAPPPVVAEPAPSLGAGMPPPGAVGTIGLGSLGTISHGGGGEPLVGHVHTGVPTLSGEGLSVDVVRRVVRRHFGEVRGCYATQLAPAPDLTGRVMLRWVIALDGSVTDVAVESSTLTATVDDGGAAALAVGTCITERAATWLFPAPTGAPVTVVYPFVLDPVVTPPEPSDDVALDPALTPSEGLGVHGTGRGGS